MKQLSSFFLSLILSGPILANPVEELEPVGSATLKVLFWSIYSSTLYTDDGIYTGIEPDLALQITYRRRISKIDLLDRTEEEWENTSRNQRSWKGWLTQLDKILPDVERGDVLVLRVSNSLASQFFFNNSLIGTIEDQDFTKDFLALWLSERSSYPKLRNKLVNGAVIIPFLTNFKSRSHAAASIRTGGKPPLSLLGRSLL